MRQIEGLKQIGDALLRGITDSLVINYNSYEKNRGKFKFPRKETGNMFYFVEKY